MKRFLLFACLLLSLTAPVSCNGNEQLRDSQLTRALEQLDQAIAERPQREVRKQAQIASLKSSFRVARSWQDRSALARSIIQEYLPYNFDSTRAWITNYRTLAEQMKHPEGVAWADIKMGEVLASAGYYMESYNLLREVKNPDYRRPELLPDYYYALFRLSDNITENSLATLGVLNIGSSSAYVDTLLSVLPGGSYMWGEMYNRRLTLDGHFEEARQANAKLRASLDKDSHEFAKAAWFESVLCDSLGLNRERLLWEIESAIGDFKNSVKDYASLNLVCTDLLDIDIDRSFRYVRTAMEDAVFYNAKLRPWQISQHLTQIQDAYETQAKKAKQRLVLFTWVISLLALMLIVGIIMLFQSNRRTIRAKREVEDLANQLKTANDDIQRSNADLSESNGIKERYIGLFLSQLSENIDKVKSIESNVIKQLRYGKSDQLLKEMLASTAVEEETDAFYDTFDSTFLAMFPDFVDQFNNLLEEPARIILKKDEKLNTELRIYALVRLGIEDSNTIAGLLKYSVRTIYNYKVKLRNAARIPREEFDEMVRKIG